MIVPDPRLVRRLRRRVRATVRANPALRRDRPRHWIREPRFPWWFIRSMLRLGFLASIAIPTWQLGVLPDTGDGIRSLLVIWTLLVTLVYAGTFAQLVPPTTSRRRQLRHGSPLGAGSPDFFTDINILPSLWVWFCLPVGDEAVFRHHAGKLLRSSLWLGVAWLVYGLVVAVRVGGLIAWLAAPGFAAAQCLVTLGCAQWFSRSQRVRPWATLAIFFFGVVVFFTFQRSDIYTPYVAPVAHVLTHYTPAGVLATAQARVQAGEPVGWLLALALGLGGAALLATGTRMLRARFSLERIFADGPQTTEIVRRRVQADEVDTPRVEPLPPVEAPPPVDLPALRARWHETLDQPSGLALFRRGWAESLLTRTLPVRQRVLMDLLQPYGQRLSTRWRTSLVLLVLAVLLREGGGNPLWSLYLSGMALMGFVFPARWAAFSTTSDRQVGIGICAFFPVSFGEIARAMLTVAAVRGVVALPLFVFAARYGYTEVPLPWPTALGLALRGLVVLLALQPIFAVGAGSSGTNDSSARWWAGLFAVVGLIGGVIWAVTLAMEMFGAQRVGVVLLCAVLLLTSSLTVVLLYAWVWGRNWFDLVPRPPRR